MSTNHLWAFRLPFFPKDTGDLRTSSLNKSSLASHSITDTFVRIFEFKVMWFFIVRASLWPLQPNGYRDSNRDSKLKVGIIYTIQRIYHIDLKRTATGIHFLRPSDEQRRPRYYVEKWLSYGLRRTGMKALYIAFRIDPVPCECLPLLNAGVIQISDGKFLRL